MAVYAAIYLLTKRALGFASQNYCKCSECFSWQELTTQMVACNSSNLKLLYQDNGIAGMRMQQHQIPAWFCHTTANRTSVQHQWSGMGGLESLQFMKRMALLQS